MWNQQLANVRQAAIRFRLGLFEALLCPRGSHANVTRFFTAVCVSASERSYLGGSTDRWVFPEGFGEGHPCCRRDAHCQCTRLLISERGATGYFDGARIP